jgi:hypothetical protein
MPSRTAGFGNRDRFELNGADRVVIKILVDPLPYVAHHIHYAKRICYARK